MVCDKYKHTLAKLDATKVGKEIKGLQDKVEAYSKACAAFQVPPQDLHTADIEKARVVCASAKLMAILSAGASTDKVATRKSVLQEMMVLKKCDTVGDGTRLHKMLLRQIRLKVDSAIKLKTI